MPESEVFDPVIHGPFSVCLVCLLSLSSSLAQISRTEHMIKLQNFVFFMTSMVVPRGTAAPVLWKWFVSRDVPTGAPFSNGTLLPLLIPSFPFLVGIHSRKFIRSMDGAKSGVLVRASRPVLLPDRRERRSSSRNAFFRFVPLLHFILLEWGGMGDSLSYFESVCGVLCLLFFRTLFSLPRDRSAKRERSRRQKGHRLCEGGLKENPGHPHMERRVKGRSSSLVFGLGLTSGLGKRSIISGLRSESPKPLPLEENPTLAVTNLVSSSKIPAWCLSSASYSTRFTRRAQKLWCCLVTLVSQSCSVTKHVVSHGFTQLLSSGSVQIRRLLSPPVDRAMRLAGSSGGACLGGVPPEIGLEALAFQTSRLLMAVGHDYSQKVNIQIHMEHGGVCILMLGVLLSCDPVADVRPVAHASSLFRAGGVNSDSIRVFNPAAEMLS